MSNESNQSDIEVLAKAIVDCCFRVHAMLGPGLLESVYEKCLAHELQHRSIPHFRQVQLPITYRDLEIPDAFRIDLLVDKKIIVEVKAVEKLERIHTAQILTYMKLAKTPLGFLMNFNVPLFTDGIRRIKL